MLFGPNCWAEAPTGTGSSSNGELRAPVGRGAAEQSFASEEAKRKALQMTVLHSCFPGTKGDEPPFVLEALLPFCTPDGRCAREDSGSRRRRSRHSPSHRDWASRQQHGHSRRSHHDTESPRPIAFNFVSNQAGQQIYAACITGFAQLAVPVMRAGVSDATGAGTSERGEGGSSNAGGSSCSSGGDSDSHDENHDTRGDAAADDIGHSRQYVAYGAVLISRSPLLCSMRWRLSELAPHFSVHEQPHLHDAKTPGLPYLVLEQLVRQPLETPSVALSRCRMLGLRRDLGPDAYLMRGPPPLFAHRHVLPPALDSPLEPLFATLSVPQIVEVFAHIMLERKVLIVGGRFSAIVAVAEALLALLYPLVFCHVYVPLLPRPLLDHLQCPAPFLIGIHSDYAFKHDFPYATDMCVVNLDDHTVASSGTKMDRSPRGAPVLSEGAAGPLPPLPSPLLRLQQQLERVLAPSIAHVRVCDFMNLVS